MLYATKMSKRDFVSMVLDLRDACRTKEGVAKCELIVQYAMEQHDVRAIRNALSASLSRTCKSADELANSMAAIIF